LSFKSPVLRLEQYVLRESILPFFLGLGLVTFLFVIDFLFDYLDLILAKGIAPLTVLELFLLALGWIFALSFPCGVLVAALMTFGRLAQDNEVTAMRALGVNLGRVLQGPLLASVVLAGLLALFNNYVLPETNHRFANLSLAIHRKRPAAKIEPGVFVNAFDNYSLLVKHIDDKTGEMRDITIYDYTQGRIPTTILAKEGTMKYIDHGATLKLDLRNGEIHEVPGEAGEGKYRLGEFKEDTIYLHNPGVTLRKLDRQSRGEREMNIAMMEREIGRLKSQRAERLQRLNRKAEEAGFPSYAAFERQVAPARGLKALVAGALAMLGRAHHAPPDSNRALSKAKETLMADRLDLQSINRRIDSFKVEIHKKFSIPVACVVFVLVGGPLGIRTRKGGFANMAIAVAFFITYYLFLIAGEQLADRGFLSPFLSMWLPNLIFGALGAYLTVSVVGWGTSRGMR
jgi:lipopolysaccharide export system permease protein